MVGVRRLLLVAFVLFGVSGCFIEVDDDDNEGRLFVEWSIDGYFDPRLCDDFYARDVQIDIVDDFGLFDSWLQECEALDLTIFLPPGLYDVELTMLDGSGVAVSDTLIYAADVFEGERTDVSADFRASDFVF